MTNAYKYLLRDIGEHTFGAVASNILNLNKVSPVIMKKLTVIFNGEAQEAIQIKNFQVNVAGNDIIVYIDSETSKDREQLSSRSSNAGKIADDNIPSTDGVVAPQAAEVYSLGGEQLATFEAMSPLRKVHEKNTPKNGETIHKTIKTKCFNITELDSVDRAIKELLEAEQTLVDQELRTIEVSAPEFKFKEDTVHFNLVQHCILWTPATTTETGKI